MAIAGESSEHRTPLNQSRIYRAGMDLADQQGIAQLSMRKLAHQLGFKVMSLYNHVASKEELLEGMADLVAAEIDDPPDGVGWKAGLRGLAISAHRALLRHPWAGELWITVFAGPERFRWSENVLQLLAGAGFSDELGDLGYHALLLHVNGFTQQQIGYSSFDEAAMAAAAERFEREVTPDRFPLMADHIEYHRRADARPGSRPDEFEFVLDLILDGLEKLRDRA